MAVDTAGRLKEITGRLRIPFIYKSSFDKANRAQERAFAAWELMKACASWARETTARRAVLTTCTKRTRSSQQLRSGRFADPAFLCRQTDFIRACAISGKPVNIKKGQFLAPGDMKNVIDKARDAAREAGLPEDSFMTCERGASFGYNNLVSDMRSLAIMRDTQAPVVFDATHSVQLPGGQGTSSGGQREFVPVLARAAVAVGVAGVFMETHPDPKNAKSDGPNAVPLDRMEELLETLVDLDRVTKKRGFIEPDFA